MLDTLLAKVVGTQNERELKRLRPIVAQVNALEASVQALSDEQLRGKTIEFRQRSGNGETLDELLPEAFAVVREAGRRVLNMRHFDVQLIGGAVLHKGKIAEMKTGEGKTLVATLPAYLNALEGNGVHVVTVNDYLARRDSEWMGKIYRFLGMTVGVIQHDLNDSERQKGYSADITYGTNNEFGFDYLRDNMKFELAHYVQRGHNFAIVDEVDSILIDEARTPLIISGPAEESTDLYYEVDRIIPHLQRGATTRGDVKAEEREELEKTGDYIVDEKHKTVNLTESGMGKADTEAQEFASIYKLDVMVIPTNRVLKRIEEPDTVYRTEKEKYDAIVTDILEKQKEGRPVLVGTVSIEKSERLSKLLKVRGIKHVVLNAKFHAQEAEIVAQAGRRATVTIATNMAGRGTDILLGGNPEFT